MAIQFFDGEFNIYKSIDNEEANDFFVIDSFSQEYIRRSAPKIEIYLADKENTEVDSVYREGNKGIIYAEPVRVNGIIIQNPIIQELTKFGIQEDNDVTFKFNYTEMFDQLGREIQVGDWIRVTLKDPSENSKEKRKIAETDGASNVDNTQGSKRYLVRYYHVTNAIPEDNYLYTYLHWSCFCEMKYPDSAQLPGVDPRDIENTENDDRHGAQDGVETNPDMPDKKEAEGQGSEGGGWDY